MKHILTLIVLIGLIGISNNSVKGQTGAEAAAYMTKLSEPLAEMKGETWQYLKALTRGRTARKIDKKRQELLLEKRKVRTEINKQSDFYNDASLKDALVDYLNLSYIILKEDYDKILDMEEIAEQSYDLMEAYLLAKEQASKKLDDAYDDLNQTQSEFAKKYGVNLIDSNKERDKTSQKIKQANEALHYYNDVYLIFFKSYKQTAYVFDAIKRNDINAIAQNTNSLSSFSDEGLQKIKEMSAFNYDIRLKRAASEILKTYKNLAENDLPKIRDFYFKKDEYEKQINLINSKNKKKLSQKEVDDYNKCVNEYNKLINDYNTNNKNLIEKSNQNIELWNKASDKFFDDHSK